MHGSLTGLTRRHSTGQKSERFSNHPPDKHVSNFEKRDPEEGSWRANLNDGGQGGSFISRILAAPGALSEVLPPAALLGISLILSAFLIGISTATLAGMG
jgi:hypothetical protein